MSITILNARVWTKGLTGGATPTIPTAPDHNDPAWLTTDIYRNELALNNLHKLYSRFAGAPDTIVQLNRNILNGDDTDGGDGELPFADTGVVSFRKIIPTDTGSLPVANTHKRHYLTWIPDDGDLNSEFTWRRPSKLDISDVDPKEILYGGADGEIAHYTEWIFDDTVKKVGLGLTDVSVELGKFNVYSEATDTAAIWAVGNVLGVYATANEVGGAGVYGLFNGTGAGSISYGVFGGNTGTMDTTSTEVEAVAIFATSSATRASGSNDLINIGLKAEASGGQKNYALYVSVGSVYINSLANDNSETNFVVWNSTDKTLEYRTLASLSIGSGTVTSVALSMPGIFSVSGSPVTGAGTLTASLATQTANTIFAGPSTGVPATPTFRALVADDIPTLAQSKITDLTSDLAAKEPTIASGTSAQYWRGDKTWQTLDKTAVGLSNVENTALSTWAGSANLTILGDVATYNGISVLENGLPSCVAVDSRNTQSAAIAATTVYTADEDGYYMVLYNATITRAATTSCVLGPFQARYTEVHDSVVKTFPTSSVNFINQTNNNSTASAISGSFMVHAKSGSAIQFIMGYTSSGATSMQYNLEVVVLKL